MANDDHIVLPRKGVDAWSAWRKQHAVEPDLRGASRAAIGRRQYSGTGRVAVRIGRRGERLSVGGRVEVKALRARVIKANGLQRLTMG
jgi:hypothetical protein